MTEPRSMLEQRVRAAVTSLRPGDGAPLRLRERVRSIADPPGRRWPVWSRATFGQAVAVMAAVAAVAFFAARGRVPLGSGSGNAPAATLAFDPSIDGLGIFREVIPSLLLIPPLVGLVVVGIAARSALRHGTWKSWRFLAGVLAGVTVGAVSLHPGFAFGSSYGGDLGYDVQVPPPLGADYPSTWYETAQPGGTLMLYITLRNDGPLPIRVDGLLETNTAETPLISRWTSLWLGDDPNAFGSSLENLVPFTPQTVEPGVEVQVYLVGRAGLCVFGPGYTLDTPIEAVATRAPTIDVVYSVLGLQAVAPVPLPMTLVEPYREHCSMPSSETTP